MVRSSGMDEGPISIDMISCQKGPSSVVATDVARPATWNLNAHIFG